MTFTENRSLLTVVEAQRFSLRPRVATMAGSPSIALTHYNGPRDAFGKGMYNREPSLEARYREGSSAVPERESVDRLPTTSLLV